MNVKELQQALVTVKAAKNSLYEQVALLDKERATLAADARQNYDQQMAKIDMWYEEERAKVDRKYYADLIATSDIEIQSR